MAYQSITNLGQLKYSSLANGLTSQYSVKNNQYPRDLILASDIMKNHQHDYYGTEKTEKKTYKHESFDKQNNSEEKK